MGYETVLANGNQINAKLWSNTVSLPLQYAVALENYSNLSNVYKFGRNIAVDTALVDLNTPGGVYAWPQTAGKIEVLSVGAAAADDANGGTGAWTVLVQGLDENWDELSEVFTMAGATPVVSDNKFIRVHRALVVTSGTYGNTTTGSHKAVITVRDEGGDGTTHIQIDSSDGAWVGQSVVARYTIPNGWRGTITHIEATIDTGVNKAATIYLFNRNNSDDITTAPYGSVRCVGYKDGVTGPTDAFVLGGAQVLPAKTDVWLSAIATAAAKVEAAFQLMLFKDAEDQ